mgnify:CR=1 FL=1
MMTMHIINFVVGRAAYSMPKNKILPDLEKPDKEPVAGRKIKSG